MIKDSTILKKLKKRKIISKCDLRSALYDPMTMYDQIHPDDFQRKTNETRNIIQPLFHFSFDTTNPFLAIVRPTL